MDWTSCTPISWAAHLGPAAGGVALALLWRVGKGREGDGGRGRSRGDGQYGGAAIAARPVAGGGQWDDAGAALLEHLGLTRFRSRDEARDELARLGLLLPAVGEADRDERW